MLQEIGPHLCETLIEYEYADEITLKQYVAEIEDII